MIWKHNYSPTVVATLLTADRQAYTERAVRAFYGQSYTNTRLLILDTGRERWQMTEELLSHPNARWITYFWSVRNGDPMGHLRNLAGEIATNADIIAHWDSDDWSAPGRLLHQVGGLIANHDADVVGYDRMYFYRKQDRSAWVYSQPGYGVGASLCYWREAWRRAPFDRNKHVGEDDAFKAGLRCTTLPGILDGAPMLIAERHEANTSQPGIVERDNFEFTRAGDEARDVLEGHLGYGV